MSLVGPYGQTFAVGDVAGVLTLVGLEALLSADNALVLALLVRHLPPEERRRALTVGLVGAFGFRLVATIFAAQALRWWPLQAAGAAYLVYIALVHVFSRESSREVRARRRGFWATVAVVELTDVAFALDSILAGVSFIGRAADKLWIVYTGAIIGIVLLRLAATALTGILERFPLLDHVAYAFVGWVGVKLGMLSARSAGEATGAFRFVEMPPPVFWGGMAAIGAVGGFASWRGRIRRSPPVVERDSEVTSSPHGGERGG